MILPPGICTLVQSLPILYQGQSLWPRAFGRSDGMWPPQSGYKKLLFLFGCAPSRSWITPSGEAMAWDILWWGSCSKELKPPVNNCMSNLGSGSYPSHAFIGNHNPADSLTVTSSESLGQPYTDKLLPDFDSQTLQNNKFLVGVIYYAKIHN